MAELPTENCERGYFDELPFELVSEILSRTQVKNLCKLKCVCKQWCDLISNCDFQSLHHEKSRQNPSMLYLDHCAKREGNQRTSSIDIYSMNLDGDVTHNMRIPSLETSEMGPVYAMVASTSLCRDIICLATDSSFYICNPSTQELMKLPELPGDTTIIGQGFGYNATRDEYILIAFIDVDQKLVCCATFNFSTKDGYMGIYNNAWRKFDNFSFENLLHCIYKGGTMVLEGNFYWLVYDYGHNVSIFSLDLGEENYETVPPPPSTSLQTFHRGYHGSLVELEGHLCMVDPTVMNPNPTMDVWILERDAETASWAKAYSISLPSGFDYKWEHVTPLGETGNCGLFFKFTRLHGSSITIPCNSTNQVWYYSKTNDNGWRQMGNDVKLRTPERYGIPCATNFCFHTDNFSNFGSR